MTKFEELELMPLVGAAWDVSGTPDEVATSSAAIVTWWRDRPFKSWDSRSAREQRALRIAARVDALVRLLQKTRP